jgi:hypothetical protein
VCVCVCFGAIQVELDFMKCCQCIGLSQQRKK